MASRPFAKSPLRAALLAGAWLIAQHGGPAAAQAPAADDIVGLRPGMTLEEIVAQLESRGDAAAIEVAEQWLRQSHGTGTRQLLRATDGAPCAAGEKAAGNAWYSECDTQRGRFEARKGASSEIMVAFTGMPGEERARSIWRRSVFAEGQTPTVEALIAALTEKYGPPHIRQTESGYYSMSHRHGATNLNWIFTPDGRPIQGNDSLRSRCVNGPKPWFAAKHSWNGDCGLTIRAEILPVPGSNLLVQVLNVSVVQQRDLITALNQFDAALQAAVTARAQTSAGKPDL